MDIIVTTPKDQIKNAAKEAEKALSGEVSHYFRHFKKPPIDLNIGDKVFYVEDGYVRGFAVVVSITTEKGVPCSTTGLKYGEGVYVWMPVNTWNWIKPIPMKGFQGFRYVPDDFIFEVVGDWIDKKPEII